MKKIVKFDIKELLPIGLTLVVFGVGIAYGLNVMGDIRGDMLTGTACNSTTTSGCGYDYNASVEGINAVSKIPEKLPLIATVIVAVIIIGLLVRYLMVRM